MSSYLFSAYSTRFQFTLPRGERPPWSAFWNSLLLFQFTLPRGERRGPIRRGSRARTYFNSRSHAGSDLSNIKTGETATMISIHAPTRGANFNSRSHAGSDVSGESSEAAIYEFQFTLPRGERPLSRLGLTLLLVDFNSRSHAGSDGIFAPSIDRCSYFNSRSHAGSDHLPGVERGGLWYFNSRSHAGSDLRWPQRGHLGQISIHAPTRGATARP